MEKEAFFFNVPCVTLRDEREWVEMVEAGWSVLDSSEKDKIINAVSNTKGIKQMSFRYGNGEASKEMIEIICKVF